MLIPPFSSFLFTSYPDELRTVFKLRGLRRLFHSLSALLLFGGPRIPLRDVLQPRNPGLGVEGYRKPELAGLLHRRAFAVRSDEPLLAHPHQPVGFGDIDERGDLTVPSLLL